MRRKFPVILRVAVLAACVILVPSRAAGTGEFLSRGVSGLVFHLSAYDEYSRLLQQGQGIVVGSQGAAIVSVSTLEGAAHAVATMMDGSTLFVRGVNAVDEVSGLAKISLQRGAPSPTERLTKRKVPQVGERVIFSDLTVRGEQVCVECSITSVRIVPDLEGLYYMETSQSVPQPGGGVFAFDGRLIGVVVMRFGNARSGLMASNERFLTLASQRARRTALDVWTNQKDDKWSDTAYARYMRGQVAFWQGQPDATLELIEDYVGSYPVLQMNIAALLGEAYLAMDLLPEAILAFRSAIDLGSSSCRVYRKLAWAYMETGQYVQAEEMCYEAIRMDPDSSSGYTLLAHLRNLQGDFKQAIYGARRAIKRDPNRPCAHFERGCAYIGLARYGAAIESLINATTLDPEYGAAFNKLGYAYLRSGKPLAAVVVLKEAVKLEPEMAAAWDNLGEAYSRAGLPGKALIALRQAVCLDPSRSHGYCRLAKEFMRQGHYSDAVDILRQGVDRCAGSQWLAYYLGKAFLLEGSINLAREQAELIYRENKELAGQLLRIINFDSVG